jgi:hypothetical protein
MMDAAALNSTAQIPVLSNGAPLLFLPPLPHGYVSKNVFNASTDTRPLIREACASHSHPSFQYCILGADYAWTLRMQSITDLLDMRAHTQK